MKMTNTKIWLLLMGFMTGALIGFCSGPDAKADGFDPNLVKNSDYICGVLDNATTVKPVQDVFRQYGRQYTETIVHATCSQHDLKVFVALQNFHMEEDDPGWDCATDGNKICGREQLR